MSNFETNDTGTIRSLNLTQMALVLALKVVDALMTGPIDLDQAEQDMRDLNALRAELHMEAD